MPVPIHIKHVSSIASERGVDSVDVSGGNDA